MLKPIRLRLLFMACRYFSAWRRLISASLARVVAGCGGAGVLLSFTLSSFTQLAAILIDEKYAVYGQPKEVGGKVQVAFLLGQALLLL